MFTNIVSKTCFRRANAYMQLGSWDLAEVDVEMVIALQRQYLLPPDAVGQSQLHSSLHIYTSAE
jgi:hypothetical protein